jgi:hypothetical protein
LYQSHPAKGYELRPGAHHQYITPELSVSLDVSVDGVRGAPIDSARLAGYRILTIGDSFTFGLGVAQWDTWSAKLEQLLRTEYPERRISVVNGGVSGYSARQIRQRFEELLPAVDPDLVILGLTAETFNRMQDQYELFGGMAVRSSVMPYLRLTKHGIVYSPFKNAYLRTVDYWLNEHFQLGAHLLSAGNRFVLAYEQGRGHAPALNRVDSTAIRDSLMPMLDEMSLMHQITMRREIPFLVLLIDAQRSDGSFNLTPDLPLSLYNRIVMERCVTERIECIDLLPALIREAAGRPILRTAHDQHWTPEAHELAAEALLRAIRPDVDGHAYRKASRW